MNRESFTKTVRTLILKAAKKYKVEPYDVTTAQFASVAGNKVQEWQLRKLGGFTGIRGLEFPEPEGRAQNAVIPRARNSKIPRYRAPKLETFTVHRTQIRELYKAAKLKDDEIFRLVAQPDMHVPEHDEAALDAYCEFLEWYKPHGLVNLGDFMEMGSVSHWDARDAKPRRFIPEVKTARTVLGRIDKAAGPQCVFKRYLMGNHEDWLDQLLVLKVPELVDGLEDVLEGGLTVQTFLKLKEFGYRVIPLNEILQVGDLHFIHGYYTNKHHAAKHLEIFGVNLVYGHLHDVQSHSGVSVNGVHEATSLGCLRTLNAPFMKGKPNNWSHAFGIIEFTNDGRFTKSVPIMVNGRFSYNGRVFGKK